MRVRGRASLFFFPLLLISFLSACALPGLQKNDKEPLEDAPTDGYYAQSQGKSNTPADRLERLKQPKKKVMVLGFWNDTPVGDASLGDFAAEELKRELFLSRSVVYANDVTATSVTKDFVDGDRVQITQLVQEGRRQGANSVIIGRISKIVFRQDREEVGILRESQSAVAVDVEMKIFDVSAGREVYSVKRSGVAQVTSRVVFDQDASSNKAARNEVARDAIRDAVMKLVPDAVMSMDKMDWMGRIAKIIGNKVYINAGKSSGLLPGDILKVMSAGEEIVDPVTKAFLGRSEGLLKGTLEVTEFIGEDSSMAFIHTGGNFQEGDVVRLY